jgi:prolipoprotein diacylglyceryltransferase
LGRAQTEQGIILSKSIAWALFGGVLTAEIYKKIHNIQWSTGIILLPWIMIGLFIGRFGAIATGIRDFTYGTPTHLPWWMDFGDGILRHPTMIYEMILLISLGCIILWTFRKYESFWIKNWFYVFILVYFIYRFFVGFIQPYSTWWIGLSTYQVIAIPMVFYSIHFFKNINHSYAKQK